jgi:hypothetical protein
MQRIGKHVGRMARTGSLALAFHGVSRPASLEWFCSSGAPNGDVHFLIFPGNTKKKCGYGPIPRNLGRQEHALLLF